MDTKRALSIIARDVDVQRASRASCGMILINDDHVSEIDECNDLTTANLERRHSSPVSSSISPLKF